MQNMPAIIFEDDWILQLLNLEDWSIDTLKESSGFELST